MRTPPEWSCCGHRFVRSDFPGWPGRAARALVISMSPKTLDILTKAAILVKAELPAAGRSSKAT